MRFVGPDPLQTVIDPVDAQDAATKQYVDTRVAAAAGTAGLTRKVLGFTVAAAAPAGNRTVTAALGGSYILLGLRTSVPARIRLYATTAAATADAGRAVTADPAATVALICEYVTADGTAVPVCPAVVGAPFGQAGTTVVITNNSGVTADVGVELTYLALEA